MSKKGITVLGIRYHSEALARWFMHNTSKEVRVRWYSEDLGAIAVELDGEWIEVPSVFARFRGERAQTWLMAVREIRASVAAQKKVDQEVIFKAMTRIREINANAMARQGLFVEDFSKERIKSLEDRLLIGFETDDMPRDPLFPSGADGLGLELQTAQTSASRDAVDAGAMAPAAAVQVPSPGNGVSHDAGPDEEDDWSFEDK